MLSQLSRATHDIQYITFYSGILLAKIIENNLKNNNSRIISIIFFSQR